MISGDGEAGSGDHSVRDSVTDPCQTTSKISGQRMADGTYRVSARAGRSALTGRFVKSTAAGRVTSTDPATKTAKSSSRG